MAHCKKCGQSYRLLHVCTAHPPQSGKQKEFCPKCGTQISERKWYGDHRGWTTGVCPVCNPGQAYFDDDV